MEDIYSQATEQYSISSMECHLSWRVTEHINIYIVFIGRISMYPVICLTDNRYHDIVAAKIRERFAKTYIQECDPKHNKDRFKNGSRLFQTDHLPLYLFYSHRTSHWTTASDLCFKCTRYIIYHENQKSFQTKINSKREYFILNT